MYRSTWIEVNDPEATVGLVGGGDPVADGDDRYAGYVAVPRHAMVLDRPAKLRRLLKWLLFEVAIAVLAPGLNVVDAWLAQAKHPLDSLSSGELFLISIAFVAAAIGDLMLGRSSSNRTTTLRVFFTGVAVLFVLVAMWYYARTSAGASAAGCTVDPIPAVDLIPLSIGMLAASFFVSGTCLLVAEE